MSEKKLLTSQEIADYLKISRRTLTRYIDQGMPTIRVSTRKNLYDLEAVNVWLQQHSNQ
jgi:excisionase family DNA binding protein